MCNNKHVNPQFGMTTVDLKQMPLSGETLDPLEKIQTFYPRIKRGRKLKLFMFILERYSNSNTFHVESIVRFKNMQTKLVNAFLIKNGKMVNSLNS